MSLAATIVVRPSLCLRLLLAGFVASVALSAWWAAQPLLLLPAVYAAFALRRLPNCARLDISGVGQMRLAVYQQVCAVELLPGCTLWPGLIVLRLAGEGGERFCLVVLPDSVGHDAFRRLAVAVQALAQKT